MPKPGNIIPESNSEKKVMIGLAGDVMLGRLVNEKLNTVPYDYVWGDVLPVMKAPDFNLINLETALTNSDQEVAKTFNFKASPDRVKCLTTANVAVVNLANNHVLDYAEAGLLETITTLQEEGIEYAGAGYNRHDAAKAARLSRKGIHIGILGFTDNEPGWKAGEHTPGVNYIDLESRQDKEAALSAIQVLSKETDCCIVSIHWGPNMRQRPPRHFISFAHAMIEHGADIIHGHSAHIFQGIEVYKNKLILYDTGDFVDDYYVDPLLRNDRSFFFICTINENGPQSLQLIPVVIDHCRVNLAGRDDHGWCIQRMQQLSAPFKTEISDQGEVMITGKIESGKTLNHEKTS